MLFGEALDFAKMGYPICRKGWNEKNLFVFMQVPSIVPFEMIARMQSVPQRVKEIVIKRDRGLEYSNQMAIVDQANNVKGWAPSVSDTLADDWEIYEEGA